MHQEKAVADVKDNKCKETTSESLEIEECIGLDNIGLGKLKILEGNEIVLNSTNINKEIFNLIKKGGV